MPANRFYLRVIWSVVVSLAMFVNYAAAQVPRACSGADINNAYQANVAAMLPVMKKATFAQRVVQRRRSADLSTATPASDPIQIVGGVTDTGGNPKIRAGAAFSTYGVSDVTATIPDSVVAGVKKANLLDGLDIPQAFTIRPRVSWTKWKGILPEALRNTVCEQTVALRDSLERMPSANEFMKFSAAQPETGQTNLLNVGDQLVIDASYEVGHQSFEFAHPSQGYAKAEARHKTQAVNLTTGIVHPFNATNDSLLSAMVTYRRQHAYESAAPGSLCRPLDNTVVSQCEELAIGAPTLHNTNKVQMDVRYWGNALFSPGIRITRDFKQRVDTFEVPVFFLTSEFGTKSTGGLLAV